MTDWDLALEALVTILRLHEQQPAEPPDPDRGTRAGLFESWIRHLLFIAPPPEPLQAPPRGESGRDWDGLTRFVARERELELSRFVGALTDLRASLTTMAESMSELVEASRETDALARAQLEHLLQAIHTSSPEEIRHAVANTVLTVGTLFETRQTYQEGRIEALSQQVRALTAELGLVRQEAELDPVTRLDSRRTFDEKVARAASLKRMCNDGWCLLLIEVDHFDRHVVSLGGPAGEAILKRLARLIAQTFPRKGDCLARYDEHRFAVILRDASLEDGRRLSDRLLREVRAIRLELEGRAIPLTLSIGAAEVQAGENTHRWLTRARGALTRALEDGHDRVITAAPA